MLGDHQPSTIVSGFGGNRDVPVTVIARDPRVVAPDLRLGVAGRPATGRPRAGLADGRLPRPLPHGLQQPGTVDVGRPGPRREGRPSARLPATARWARAGGFPPGEFVGQESFVTAGEVLSLGRRAGIAPGVRVLDLCCGAAGPGLHLARELGCTYLGVDASPRRRRPGPAAGRRRGARRPLRARAGSRRCRPVRSTSCSCSRPCSPSATSAPCCGRSPRPCPSVVASPSRSRRALPLTAAERGRDARVRHGVAHPARPPAGRPEPGRPAGPLVRRDQPRAPRHRRRPGRRVHRGGAGAARGWAPAARRRPPASHRLWSRWLREGRVRKFAVVAEKR